MEELKVIILGSGSIVPTPTRNHAAIWIRHGQDILLWDCGEGTQLQLQKAGLSFMNIDKIFITHWHADHFAGLIGLLETFDLEGREEKLQIIGPQANKYYNIISNLHQGSPEFEIEIKDIDFETPREQVIINEKYYKIKCVPANHNIPAVAYALEEKDRWNIDMEKAAKYNISAGPILRKIKKEGFIKYKGKIIKLKDIANLNKGRKIVYSGDTAPSTLKEDLAENATVLIHDSTFLNKSSEHHSTVKEAASIGKRAEVEKLVLTHYSRRYEDLSRLKKIALNIYDNIELASDLLEVY